MMDDPVYDTVQDTRRVARRQVLAWSGTAVVGLFSGQGSSLLSSAGWTLSQVGNDLRIFYTNGSGATFQFASLNLASAYFRLIYGPTAGWGTSVVLLPSYWASGVYYQGAPISASWHVVSPNLRLAIAGTIGGLSVSVSVSLAPPNGSSITARVTMQVSGSVTLDPRPGEAYKPVFLSSMHESSTIWDAQSAYVDCHFISIPLSSWIIPVQPPTQGRKWGLLGGTSSWKVNAPTVEIALAKPLQITGYVTPSTNPNDDNVGFWAAATSVLRSFSYTIMAAPGSSSCHSNRSGTSA